MSDSNESIMYSSQEETPATVQNTEHTDNRERKQRISLDQSLFDTIERMVAKNENKDSIISATGLSRSAVYKDVIIIDNSYTQVGIKTQLENINSDITRNA
ncbi:hypothetical protein HZS_5618 [Henneguya salminicola]|nr:hypothetical protein HZS_5618 [Henneguya salminicola]